MDPDPPPSLLWQYVQNTVVDRPRHLEHRVPVPEEALQSGGGGSDAEEAARVRATDPFHPGIADALECVGMVNLSI